MNTKFLTSKEAEARRGWVLIDAESKVVGRLASDIASVLHGKNKPYYSGHQDCGDFVVVVNAEKAVFTGNKTEDKVYYRHTGYVGGIKDETARELMDRRPEEILRRAVKGMLPRTDIGKRQLAKLKVYSGADHPHAAQQPKPL